MLIFQPLTYSSVILVNHTNFCLEQKIYKLNVHSVILARILFILMYLIILKQMSLVVDQQNNNNY